MKRKPITFHVLTDLYRNLRVCLKHSSLFLLKSALHLSQSNCINSRVKPNSSNPSNMLVIPQYPILVKNRAFSLVVEGFKTVVFGSKA